MRRVRAQRRLEAEYPRRQPYERKAARAASRRTRRRAAGGALQARAPWRTRRSGFSRGTECDRRALSVILLRGTVTRRCRAVIPGRESPKMLQLVASTFDVVPNVVFALVVSESATAPPAQLFADALRALLTS